MNKTVLFIDGENFRFKIEEVLKQGHRRDLKITNIDFNKLLEKPLQDLEPYSKIFYAAKLRFHQDSPDKSRELISQQRKLRNNLVKQGFDFIIAGNVRAQRIEGSEKK